MTTRVEEGFTHIRHVDFDRLASLRADERYAQMLLDHDSGARTCTVAYIRTPAGGGSPAGMHTHEVDQIFFVISGTMSIEIQGERSTASSGSLVVFPAHVPHRNWNDGPEPTVHLALNVPLTDPAKPFAVPVANGRQA